MRRKSLSIKARLSIVVSAFSVLAVVAMGCVAYRLAYGMADRSADDHAEDSSERLAALVSSELAGAQGVLRTLAAADAATSLDSVEAGHLLAKVLAAEDGSFASLSLADESGRASGTPGAPADISGLPCFKQAIVGDARSVGEPYANAAGAVVVPLAAPIVAAGGIVGVVLGEMKASRLLYLVGQRPLGASGEAFIVDRSGRAVAHTNQALAMDLVVTEDPRPGLAEIGRRMVAGAKGSGSYGDGGRERTAFFAPVPGTLWSIAVTCEKAELLAPLAGLRWAIAILAVAVAALSALLSILAVRRGLQSLDGLGRSFAALGEGDLTVRAGLRDGDEVGTIARIYDEAMDGLAAILRGAREANAASAALSSELAASAEESSAATEEIEASMHGMEERGRALTEAVGESERAVAETRAGVEGLNAIIARQAEALERSSASMGDILAGLGTIGEASRAKLTAAREAAERARKGGEAMREASRAVAEIEGGAAAMLETVRVINGIASRTNLLAMNAAIEAAHAGDFGRGFSVVADEIRKLSNSASDNAKSVASALRDLVGKVSATAARSASADAIFASMLEDAAETERGMAEAIDGIVSLVARGGAVVASIAELRETGESVAGEGRSIAGRMDIVEGAMRESGKIAEGNAAALAEVSLGLAQVSAAVASLSELSCRGVDAVSALEERMARFAV